MDPSESTSDSSATEALSPVSRDKNFMIRPSGPLRKSSYDPDYSAVDLQLAQDPSEAEFVRKLSTMRHERKTLTRTLRKRQEQEKTGVKRSFAAGLEGSAPLLGGDLEDTGSDVSTSRLITKYDEGEAKAPKKRPNLVAPVEHRLSRKSREVSMEEGEAVDKHVHSHHHQAGGAAGIKRKGSSFTGDDGQAHKDNELQQRMSTFSEDFDGDDPHERLHRRRSKSNPGIPNHSVKFELTEMDKMATGEYLSFEDLKRRQSISAVPVHPHNYKQWLRKKQADVQSDEEEDQGIDPSPVLQPLANPGGYESPAEESDGEGDGLTSRGTRSSKDNTASSLSLSLGTPAGGTPSATGTPTSPPSEASKRSTPKHQSSVAVTSKTGPASPGKTGPLWLGESHFFSFGHNSNASGNNPGNHHKKGKKRRRLQPEAEKLYPWEHFSLQQAIMGTNVFLLLAAFAVLFGVSAWSVSQLGQQTSSFIGNSTLEFMVGNISAQFHVAQELMGDLEDAVLLNRYTFLTDENLLSHTLALLLDPTAVQSVGAIFYAEPSADGSAYLEVQSALGATGPWLGTVSAGTLTYAILDPTCPLTNSSCDLQGPTVLTIPSFSTAPTPWNQSLMDATDPSQVNFTTVYVLPSGVYGMVLAQGYANPLFPRGMEFQVGVTLEPLRLSAALLDLRQYLDADSEETDLLAFMVDSEAYLFAVSLENPDILLFTAEGERVVAASCPQDGIGDIYAAYLALLVSSPDPTTLTTVQVVAAGSYLGLVSPISFGGRTFHVIVSVKNNALVGRYQTTQYVVIAVTFFVILVAILLSIRLITLRLTRSVNKVSKMMVDMANLEFPETMARESRRYHIKETERLVSATEIMNVALRSFVKYVPQEVVRILVQEGAEVIIGVDDSFLTIFFSDIEGFTTISELLEADVLIQVMSEYLEEMSQVILESGGVVDKYIGDAIMAFWNAPISVPSHRAVACAVALRMQRRLRRLNLDWVAKNIPPIRARIGINAGIALVGNLGAPQRMSYTCIGDCVNAASRLENLNKQYGTYIMISENIYQSKNVQENFLCRTLDKVCVKGKSQSLVVYELVCELKVATDDIKAQLKLFNEGYELYQRREFAAAARHFSRFLKINPDDKAAEVLRQRCKTFVKNPPSLEWDGSYIALEK